MFKMRDYRKNKKVIKVLLHGVEFPLHPTYHGDGAWIKLFEKDEQGIVRCEVISTVSTKYTLESGDYILRGVEHDSRRNSKKSLTLHLTKQNLDGGKRDFKETVYFRYRTSTNKIEAGKKILWDKVKADNGNSQIALPCRDEFVALAPALKVGQDKERRRLLSRRRGDSPVLWRLLEDIHRAST